MLQAVDESGYELTAGLDPLAKADRLLSAGL